MISILKEKIFLSLMILFSFGMALSSTAFSQESSSEGNYAMKEFMRSATYGVMAGTLVGAATLAFTDQPGENLNRVARGASLGLYAGIILGLYAVYIVPRQLENESKEKEMDIIPSEDDYGMHFQIYPIISLAQQRDGSPGAPELNGAMVQWQVLQF